MGYEKCGRVIAKGKERKDMGEECAVASRPEGSGSDKGSCAQIVWKTSVWARRVVRMTAVQKHERKMPPVKGGSTNSRAFDLGRLGRTGEWVGG
jgi:hypothetical protein